MRPQGPNPPALAERLVAFFLRDRRWREVTLGDMAEEFAERAAHGTAWRASLWYWRQTLALLPRLVADPFRAFLSPTGDSLVTSLGREARLAVRSLVNQPLVTGIILVTLALSLGSNIVTFGLIDRLVLRPFAIPDVDRLVLVSEHVGNQRRGGIPVSRFFEWRDRTTTLRELVAFGSFSVNVSGVDQPERIDGQRVSGGFFALLGAAPAHGRGLDTRDEVTGQHRRVVLSDALWRRRFDANPGAVGRTIRLDGADYDIVGIGPRGFDFPDGSQFWVPLDFREDDAAGRSTRSVSAIARLSPGQDVTAAGGEMSAVFARQKADHPDIDQRRRITVWRFAEGMIDNGTPKMLSLLELTAVLVLLIGCTNIASLLLARGTDRQRDLGVRLALGAGRGQIVRQLLVESVVLALVAAPAALAVAWGVFQILQGMVPPDVLKFIYGWTALSIDTRVVLFAFGGALVTSVIFGLLPALMASRVEPTTTLRDGGRTQTAGPGRLRHALIVVEIALAVPLLVASGMAAAAGHRLAFGPQGYNPDGVFQFRTILPAASYPNAEAQRAFADRLLEAAGQVTGVTDVGIASVLPSSNAYSDRAIAIEGLADDGNRPRYVNYRQISPAYLDTMQIPIVAGRGFTEADRETGQRVSVVTESLARQYFAGEAPLGRRIRLDSTGNWTTVVGVSRDTIDDWINARGIPTVYVPIAQSPTSSVNLVARTSGDPSLAADGLRRALASVDPDQPAFNERTMRDLIYWRTSGLRLIAALMSGLGMLALVLAAFGVYGLMATSVARRRHEFGVRMALGASTRDVLLLAVRQAALLTSAGIAVGLAAGIAVARIIEGTLSGVMSGDLSLFSMVTALLVFVAAVATVVPARRATRLDPAIVLKE